MRIELRTSGGVAGVRRPPVVVDTATLADEERAALEAIAARVDLATAPARPAGPDRLQHELTIDGRRFGPLHEGTLDPDTAELIARVRRLGA